MSKVTNIFSGWVSTCIITVSDQGNLFCAKYEHILELMANQTIFLYLLIFR